MSTKEIFRNRHYSACVMRDGSLVVTSNAVQREFVLHLAKPPKSGSTRSKRQSMMVNGTRFAGR